MLQKNQDQQFECVECAHAPQCSGCAWIAQPYSWQRQTKVEDLRQKTGLKDFKISFVATQPSAVRDRADFVIDHSMNQRRIGLFSQIRSQAGDRREIVDLESCAQLSSPLNDFYREFRKIPIDVQRGSVRLRVAPDGTRGVWLDFANLDVARLLSEENVLRRLKDIAIVEIGQRRKRLIERDGRLKLGDAELAAWFETYLVQSPNTSLATIELSPTPMFGAIGSFTQPGVATNRVLITEALRSILRQARPKQVLELGAGSGNFTVPLACLADHVEAWESDPLACLALKQTVSAAGLESKVSMQRRSFQIAAQPLLSPDWLICDPPRSGLQGFLNQLTAILKEPCPNLLYVSCFAESFAQDLQVILQHGYTLQELKIVDQFPQTPHYEIIAAFQI